MRALVTGAAGFLGSHLTDLLLERGERPRVLIRPGEAGDRLAAAGAEVHVADICDRAAIGAAMLGIDRVLHCAARTGPWGPPADYERVNVRGLEILVRSAMAAGVRRIVHVSSITVHGIDIRGQADEDAPLRREPNPYSRSKLAGERLLQRLIRDEGAPVTIVRPGWIYGPRDTASFARFARLVEKCQMVIIGSGNNHVPLVYVEDVAQGIALASTAREAEGQCYLLVNDERVSQREFFETLATELAVPPPARHLPYRPAVMLAAGAEMLGRLVHRIEPPPVTRYGIQLLGGENRFVISRARSELGWCPQVGLVEGVRRSVQWYRAAGRAPMITEERV